MFGRGIMVVTTPFGAPLAGILFSSAIRFQPVFVYPIPRPGGPRSTWLPISGLFFSSLRRPGPDRQRRPWLRRANISPSHSGQNIPDTATESQSIDVHVVIVCKCGGSPVRRATLEP